MVGFKNDVKFGGVGIFQTRQLEDGRWEAYSDNPNKFSFVGNTKEEVNTLAKEFMETLAK